MFIINNLLSLLEKKGLKQADLCEAIKISSSTMTNWKNRGTDPPAKYIIPICEFLDITPYLLLTNKESSSKNELSKDEQALIGYFKNLSDKSKGIVLGKAETLAEIEESITPKRKEPQVIQTTMLRFEDLSVSAGTGEPLDEGGYHTYIKVKKSEEVDEADFAVRIHGDSMSPHFNDGDIVLVNAQPQINNGQIGIFTVNDMGYIKKLGTDRLISINPEYDDIYFEEEQEIRCKGLVIGTLEEDDFV